MEMKMQIREAEMLREAEKVKIEIERAKLEAEKSQEAEKVREVERIKIEAERAREAELEAKHALALERGQLAGAAGRARVELLGRGEERRQVALLAAVQPLLTRRLNFGWV